MKNVIDAPLPAVREGCKFVRVYDVEDTCNWGGYVSAKVFEDSRRHGFGYICLVIPGTSIEVIIELDDPNRSASQGV